MKTSFKRLISLLILILITATLLASCSFNYDLGGSGNGGTSEEEGDSGEDNKPKEEPENLIYNATSELYLIVDPALDNAYLSDFVAELVNKRTETVDYAAADSEKHKHEIVIGNTDRDISKTAIDRMSRYEKNTDDEYVYLVYSDGSSIAVVWEEDEEGVLEDYALKYLIENYLGDEVVMRPGAKTFAVDLLEDHYRVQDEAFKLEQWALFEERYGKELTEAYKQLYAIYSPDCITWLANLYDPDICVCVDLYGEEECSGTKYCGTGGWYYSNSARDTMGYLPDAESTNQALNFLVAAGLAAQRSRNNYLQVITDEMKIDIPNFIYSLEEPNGYFYHPQWGIELTDSKLSRRARDLSWCCGLLTTFGKTPKYTTASGMKGEDAAGTSANLTGRLGSSVSAVSKVIATADDAYASHLQDLNSFAAYLATKDIYNNSYSVGNELTSQTPQIKERDKQIGTPDNPTPLMDYLINWLNTNQNPETGHWDWKKPGEVGYRNYHGTNGLLKITGIYSTHGVVMPYSREAAMSAMYDIINPAQISAVTDLYNTWYAIENIIGNLRTYGGEEGDREADEIQAELRTMAPEGIRVSRDKIKDFLKPDGSASYGREYSSSTSQGVPAAVPNSVEGDVNGSTIAINGIIGHSASALGVTKVPTFGESERYLFRKTINNLGPILKGNSTVTPDPLDFSYEEIGDVPTDLSVDFYAGNGIAHVIADPTGAGMDNVFYIKGDAYDGKGDSVRILNQNSSAVAKSYVFESDFYIEETNASYPVQITMGSCYMLSFRVSGNEISVVEASSGSSAVAMEEYLGIKTTTCNWFKLRVEYYLGDHDTVRIKVYADTDLTDNEGLKLYAVSDNYYDNAGVKVANGVGTPSKSFTSTHIYVMSNAGITMYLDNVSSYMSSAGYAPVSDPNGELYLNVDKAGSDRVVYDFEDGTLPADITASGNAAVENDALKLTGGSTPSSFTVPVTLRDIGARCGYLSVDITPEKADVGNNVLLIQGMDDGDKVFGINLLVAEDTDGKYLALQPTGKITGAVMEDVRIPFGEATKLELEYYHNEDLVVIYVDGEFVGATDILYDQGNKRTLDRFTLTTYSDKTVEAFFDNVIAEKTAKTFSEAVAPTVPANKYDFNDGSAKDIILTGKDVSISSYNGGKAIIINSSGAPGSITIPVNKRANLVNTVTIDATFEYVSAAKSGVAHYIEYVDEDGNVIAAFALVANNSKVELYEISKGGLLSNPVCTFDATTFFNLKIQMFTDNKVIHIFHNGTVVGKSGIFVGDEFLENGVASVKITSKAAKTTLAIDDLTLESLYDVYTDVKVSGKDNPETDLSKGITFEYSNSGNFPSPLTMSLAGGNVAKINNVLNSITGAYSNVFVFEKTSTGNDELAFKSNVSPLGKGMVFDADVKVNMTSDKHLYRIYFGTDGRKNLASMIYLGLNGNDLWVGDISNASNTQGTVSNTVNTDVKNGEWFHLRVEYYKGTRDTVRTRILINGEVVMVSDNFAGKENSTASPHSYFNCVTFYAMGSTRGELYLDNVYITSTNEECTDPLTVTKK